MLEGYDQAREIIAKQHSEILGFLQGVLAQRKYGPPLWEYLKQQQQFIAYIYRFKKAQKEYDRNEEQEHFENGGVVSMPIPVLESQKFDFRS